MSTVAISTPHASAPADSQGIGRVVQQDAEAMKLTARHTAQGAVAA